MIGKFLNSEIDSSYFLYLSDEYQIQNKHKFRIIHPVASLVLGQMFVTINLCLIYLPKQISTSKRAQNNFLIPKITIGNNIALSSRCFKFTANFLIKTFHFIFITHIQSCIFPVVYILCSFPPIHFTSLHVKCDFMYRVENLPLYECSYF